MLGQSLDIDQIPHCCTILTLPLQYVLGNVSIQSRRLEHELTVLFWERSPTYMLAFELSKVRRFIDGKVVAISQHRLSKRGAR
jgi:hypothetical protein